MGLFKKKIKSHDTSFVSLNLDKMQTPARKKDANLTDWEFKVCEMAADGYTNQEIANAFHTSFWSVANAVKSATEKTQARNRAELWKWVVPEGSEYI